MRRSRRDLRYIETGRSERFGRFSLYHTFSIIVLSRPPNKRFFPLPGLLRKPFMFFDIFTDIFPKTLSLLSIDFTFI
jgi:hypothetical protein